MNYYSEKDIRDIVARVVADAGLGKASPAARPQGQAVPVEVSARHVHLTQADVDALFGPGYELKRARDLSQPGQYLCAERVKLVTAKGQLGNVGILGPLRKQTQVELSMTDARSLGINAPVRLSGDLAGAADVILVGPAGVLAARGAVIVAKAHIHMTPADAQRYGVSDGEHVGLCLGDARALTLQDVIVRVRPDFALAAHIDFDEANAAQVGGSGITGLVLKESR